MIHVEKLTKDYGNRRAVSDLDFSIEKGEIVGFLGPNGAGKTTTMRILAGYLPPSYGKVEIGGYDILDQSLQVRKLVGYLPETIPLYNDMTVFNYLNYMASLRNLKDREARVEEVTEILGLADRLDGYIGKLSKGMRQRVGLAQAIIHRPEVLILDEPTIGLDPAQLIEVRNLIKDIGREHTVLLSTHILPEVEQVCDRVLIINNGRIVAEDTTERLQSRLMGSQRIVLKIRDDVNEISSLVASTPGVISIHPRDDNTMEFETAAGDDARAEVARRVVKAGQDLLELRTISMSLEEIFLKITREEPTVIDEIVEDYDTVGRKEA